MIVTSKTLEKHLNNFGVVFVDFDKPILRSTCKIVSFQIAKPSILVMLLVEKGHVVSGEGIYYPGHGGANQRKGITTITWCCILLPTFCIRICHISTSTEVTIKVRTTWKWAEDQQTAFETLKMRLTRFFRLNPWTRGWRVIAYASRTLNGPKETIPLQRRNVWLLFGAYGKGGHIWKAVSFT